jgi:transmembrane sensor
VRTDRHPETHPESLLDQAIRGELAVADRAALERHLTGCPDCAAEIEAARVLATSMAPGKQDEALNRAAVEAALIRLQRPESLGDSLRRWLGAARRPAFGFALVGAAAAAVAITIAIEHAKPAAPPHIAKVTDARTLHLTDGSEITPVGESTTVEIAEQTPARTTVRLRSGGAQFRVRHDEGRVFRVDAGAIKIEDLGTTFRVAHASGGKIRVAVSEGRVAVLQAAGQARVELGAGEERVFASQPASGENPAPAAAPLPPPASAPTGAPPRNPLRAHAADEPADLLLAADAARRSRHPEAAVAPLRRLLDRHAKDPRAPAAAFTLGWVLLTDLGRAREAAAAFAEAERIAPRGALAEDAAARVAEAWQKAGDPARAARAARHYADLYPSGRFMALMRGLIGEH